LNVRIGDSFDSAKVIASFFTREIAVEEAGLLVTTFSATNDIFSLQNASDIITTGKLILLSPHHPQVKLFMLTDDPDNNSLCCIGLNNVTYRIVKKKRNFEKGGSAYV
jgi:hypothetical protein